MQMSNFYFAMFTEIVLLGLHALILFHFAPRSEGNRERRTACICGAREPAMRENFYLNFARKVVCTQKKKYHKT